MTVWQRVNLTAWFLVALIVVLLISSGLAEKMCARASAENTTNVVVTFYGFPDNSPPGTKIHWPVIHSQAGGSGTFGDPTTVAVSAGSRWKAGTRMYLPMLSKYLIVEDSCSGCGTNHIDVWVGGAGQPGGAVEACERSLTPSGTVPVEIDPPAGRPVSAGQLC